jgi:hypothetical protein
MQVRKKYVFFCSYSFVFQLTWTKMAGIDHNPKLHYRTGGVANVVENLPSKHETLSSSPSTAKKNQVAFSKSLQVLYVSQSLPAPVSSHYQEVLCKDPSFITSWLVFYVNLTPVIIFILLNLQFPQ